MTGRLVFLLLVFLAVPVVLYRLLEAADTDKRALLLGNVQERGRLVLEILRPDIERQGLNALPLLDDRLQKLVSDDTTLRLFFKPSGGTDPAGFFYLAAAPGLTGPELAAEQAELGELGVFDTLARSCVNAAPLVTRHVILRGSEEIIIAATPLITDSGCWSLLTAFSTAAFRDSSIGRPYWETPEIRVGTAIYIVMFVVTLTVFWGIWQSLRRLIGRSRSIRARGLAAGRFADEADLDEFSEVARELDRLVNTLHQSSQTLKAIAEQNAHAFKTPLAVIRQSVEPVRKRAGDSDPRLARAVTLIDASLDKLDELVAVAWRMDEAMADLLDPPREPIDLSALLDRIAGDYRVLAEGRGRHFKARIADGAVVLGGVELIEAVVENMLDNALGYTPEGGSVYLHLDRNRGGVAIKVADDGPGVAPELGDAIFDRYFTYRPSGKGAGQDGERHLGMGLWIVRRNTEALGGTVTGANRPEGGFAVTVRLPAAETN